MPHPHHALRSCFVGYVIGLAATIVVMNVFKAAQPALLYIVPAVFAFTFAAAGENGCMHGCVVCCVVTAFFGAW